MRPRRRRYLLPPIALCALLGANSTCAADAAPVAEVDGVAIPAAELEATIEPKRLELERAFQVELAAMRIRYQRAQAALAETALDKLVDDRVIALEARATRRTPEAIAAEAQATPPTEAQARAFYEREQASINAPFEAVAPAIYNLLARQSAEAANQALHARLRAKYRARVLAEPLRAAVAARGPSLGPASAPVTVVEFGDFECPFCARARAPLAELVAAFPNDVRLVFRQLPLTEIHPHAQQAAEAALCADEQGRFWEAYNAFYAAQDRLDPLTLRAAVVAAGADGRSYDECLASGRVRPRIEADVAAARELAVDGTPGLFINGRFLSGAQPIERLTALVGDELARRTSR